MSETMPPEIAAEYAGTGFAPYDPVVRNPYPEQWETVSDFSYDTDLYLARARKALVDGRNREAEYIVAAEYRCSCRVDGRPWPIVVPSGMLTDLTSSPRVARAIVNRVGPHLEAAIVHDFLFLAWQDLPGHGARRSDFRFANVVMREAMAAAGISVVVRSLIFATVSSPVAWQTFIGANPKPRYVRYREKVVLWDAPAESDVIPAALAQRRVGRPMPMRGGRCAPASARSPA
jgi:hypothetical protein